MHSGRLLLASIFAECQDGLATQISLDYPQKPLWQFLIVRLHGVECDTGSLVIVSMVDLVKQTGAFDWLCVLRAQSVREVARPHLQAYMCAHAMTRPTILAKETLGPERV
nr:hypothetical transcript [Hymenolepis microstoma]